MSRVLKAEHVEGAFKQHAVIEYVSKSLVGCKMLEVKEGKSKRAEPILRRVYEIYRKYLLEDHWIALSVKGSLAVCCGLQGEFKKIHPL